MAERSPHLSPSPPDPELVAIRDEIAALMQSELGRDIRLSAVGLGKDHVTVLVKPGEDAFAAQLRSQYGEKVQVRFGRPRLA